MTALVSAFARAYHRENNAVKVFDDALARRLLTDREYEGIAESMAQGIAFFNPAFEGDAAQALRWIVDHQLSPTPLGRAAFAEKALQTAVRIGAKQYLILGAGYDTFAYRQPDWARSLHIFEIDHPQTVADKRRRLQRAGIETPPNVHCIAADLTQAAWRKALVENPYFDESVISFCSLLGLIYYLTAQAFSALLAALEPLLACGSALAFDYPDAPGGGGERAEKQAMLAKRAGEPMRAGYSYREMERLLCNRGFLVYEHLLPQEITRRYFSGYNEQAAAHPMRALERTNFCLAVKRLGARDDARATNRQRE